MGFSLLQTWTTNYCADTVEWCPITPNLNYFICGTYQLQESTPHNSPERTSQSRIGQLHLFAVTELLQLNLLCTVDCSSGILDCKWCPRRISNETVFITANSDGKIALWVLITGEGQSEIKPIRELDINNKHIILSIDWCTNHNKSDICASDSAGNVYIVRLNENLTLQLVKKFALHPYEAWIAAFDLVNTERIYSGADDNVLKITDIQTGKLISELREHTGGVTSIRFNHRKEHIIASGSYDETVKLWDMRNVSRSLFSLNVGGGIWRIKWDPQDAGHILIAGMYSGCFWLNYNPTQDSLVLEHSLNEHKTISYGADICSLDSRKIEQEFKFELCESELKRLYRLTATCSFYDKKLCLCLL